MRALFSSHTIKQYFFKFIKLPYLQLDMIHENYLYLKIVEEHQEVLNALIYTMMLHLINEIKKFQLLKQYTNRLNQT